MLGAIEGGHLRRVLRCCNRLAVIYGEFQSKGEVWLGGRCVVREVHPRGFLSILSNMDAFWERRSRITHPDIEHISFAI